MAVITIFSASYCHGDEVAAEVAKMLGHKLIDKEVVEWASRESGIPEEKLARAMRGSTSLLDKFIREKDRYIAYVRLAAAELLKADNIVYKGFAGHLLPRDISHVLKVCLVANHDYRVDAAAASEGISEKSARRIIKKDNEERKKWTQHLFDLGPWDKKLYDIKIPMHSSTVEEAAKLICENAQSLQLQTKPESQKAMDDFALAARVRVALIEKGHNVDATSDGGSVTILIREDSIRLEHLKKELSKIAEAVPGVESVDARLGPKSKRHTVFEFEMPSKVLLVDDEKEFVQTLSERLQMRDLTTAVAYDGEEALSYLEEVEPEVMILDLRMPGIDGVEVLRRAKKKHPNVEVIILTGHGTEKDETLTRELGAFAYLEKPVEMEKLAQTVKEAYAKLRKKEAERKQENDQDT